MRVITVDAPAKINLTLNMEGRREDGYHLLSSVFQAVSLSDTVILKEREEEGIVLTMSDPDLPCDRRNTAYKAAECFFAATGISPCVNIHVNKNIPQQAGLGGGSADAAGVLVGLNRMFETGLSEQNLCDIGEKVGADVPFCIVGGTAMVTGIGEVIEPLTAMPSCFVVIAKPPVGVSTAAAYAAVDATKTTPSDQQAMREAIERQDIHAVGQLLGNAFEQALDLPEVDKLLDAMRSYSPCGCMMSGSGSAVYALFDDKDNAEECAVGILGLAKTWLAMPLACGATVRSVTEEDSDVFLFV